MVAVNATPAARMAWPWHCRVGAALVSLGFLLSCGGGGGGGGQGSPAGPPGPTVLQGAYQQASSGGNDFVSFVTPDNKLYALYFSPPKESVVTLPEIFSGVITPGQNGAAEIAALALKVFANSNSRSGSGIFSSASSLFYHLQLGGGAEHSRFADHV